MSSAERAAELLSALAKLRAAADLPECKGCVIAERGRPHYAFASVGAWYLAVYDTHVHYKRYDRPGGVVVGQGTFTRGRRSLLWLAGRVRSGLIPNPRTQLPP